MDTLPNSQERKLSAADFAREIARETGHWPVLRGAEIGHPCERALWYRFRWASPAERFSPHTLRLFEAGHREEVSMITELRAAGVDLADCDPGTHARLSVTACGGHFADRLDGVLSGLLEAPNTPHILECKTLSASSFARVKKLGVANANPELAAKLQIAMHLHGVSWSAYLAKVRNDDAYYLERVARDHRWGAALIVKANRIATAANAPAKVSDSADYHVCRFCPSAQICHDGGGALRNCRTCTHVTPINGGQWYCQLLERELSIGDQQLACPNHHFLASLETGQPDDHLGVDDTIAGHVGHKPTDNDERAGL